MTTGDPAPADPATDPVMRVARTMVERVTGRFDPPTEDPDVLVRKIGTELSRKAPDMEDRLEVFEVARDIFDEHLEPAWDGFPKDMARPPGDMRYRHTLLLHVAVVEPIAAHADLLDLTVAEPTDGPTRYPLTYAYLGLPVPDDFSTIPDWLAACRRATVQCPYCWATHMTYLGATWDQHARFADDGWVVAYHECRACDLRASWGWRTSQSAVAMLDKEIREELRDGIDR